MLLIPLVHLRFNKQICIEITQGILKYFNRIRQDHDGLAGIDLDVWQRFLLCLAVFGYELGGPVLAKGIISLEHINVTVHVDHVTMLDYPGHSIQAVTLAPEHVHKRLQPVPVHA